MVIEIFAKPGWIISWVVKSQKNAVKSSNAKYTS